MEAHTEELIITAARSALRALPTASRRRLLDEEADFIGFELVASNSPVPSPSPTPSELHSPVPFPSPTPSELEAEHPPGSAGSLSTAPPMDHGRGSGAPPIVCAMPLSSIAPLPMAPAYPLAATAFDSRSSLQFAAPNASIDAPEELLKLREYLHPFGIGSEKVEGWSARKQNSGGVVFTSKDCTNFRSMAEAARHLGASIPTAKRARATVR